MTRAPDRLYQLLPAIHRQRDEQQGFPLRALLRVIGESADLLEDDIGQLYENMFIESCAEWAVPYIGDLIGYRPVAEAGRPQAPDSAAARAHNRALTPRREIANTIAWRRRKGTLALLEELAMGVAGWPARAVEFYKLLGWTQHLNHQHPQRGGSLDLRRGARLDQLGGPFDAAAHTVDVRRIGARRSQGRHNIVSVGVFVCRLAGYPVTHTPACRIEGMGGPCFTFSVLGNDAPLFVLPRAQAQPTAIAGPLDLPLPIRRRALAGDGIAGLYGAGHSFTIEAPDWPARGAPQPLPAAAIVAADLSDWRRYRVPPGRVAVDPVLGRMRFPDGAALRKGVSVSYHYGFSADIGGGEYPRTLSQPEDSMLYRVGPAEADRSIGAALARWQKEKEARRAAAQASPEAPARPLAAVIEIADSGVYTEALAIVLEAGESLQIRAAERIRPVLRLLDQAADQLDAFAISGARASRFVLDGLLVVGRGLRISGPDRQDAEASAAGDLCDVRIRHCTLVPGWGLECDCEPKRPNEPSIELFNTSAALTIAHSIVGTILVTADEVMRDPVSIDVSDSIVDATGSALDALASPDGGPAFAVLRIARCTAIGALRVHALELAENAILLGEVRSARRQLGCVRFCYVAPGSRTPRRFHCQPDLVRQAAAAEDADREGLRVQPRFTSTRYGNPGYCQLHPACAGEIRGGADDESEMGVFHDLYQPQREANLRVRLSEYSPAAMEAGIIYANQET
ncbi:MAG: hypothetical protein ACJ8LG_02980 [Massilia sp.]